MDESNISSKGKDEGHRSLGGVSLLGGLSALLLLLITVGFSLHMLNIGYNDRIVFITVDLLIYAIGLSILVGLAFGIIGLFQKESRKVWAIIGLLLSGVVGVIYVLALLWVFG